MHHKEAHSATAEQCLHEILDVITQIRHGYFSCRLFEDMPGDAGKIAKTTNELLDFLLAFRSEHHRMMEEIGVTGRLGGQMELPESTGAWREMADATNRLGVNMTCQFRDGGNVMRDHLHGKIDSRMTANFIGSEFREFREMLNEHLDRMTNKAPA